MVRSDGTGRCIPASPRRSRRRRTGPRLVAVGLWLLFRGLFYPPKIKKPTVIAPLGLIGGFLDAAGGGGWGPVVTSNLLVQGGEPRKIIGTVNSVEFFLALAVSLASSSPEPQDLLVDYVVHHVRANGSTSPKVFKGWKLTLGPGEQRTLSKRHSLRPVTTRVLYPGQHRIELQVNGQTLAQADFELLN